MCSPEKRIDSPSKIWNQYLLIQVYRLVQGYITYRFTQAFVFLLKTLEPSGLGYLESAVLFAPAVVNLLGGVAILASF